jgi:hypothetical protein
MPVRDPRRDPRKNADNFMLGAAGVLMVAIGGYFWAMTSTVARECSSALVTMADPSSCNRWTTEHTLGGIGAIIGIVLIIVAIVRS